MELVATFSPELLAAPERLGGPPAAALRLDGRHGRDPPGFAALLAGLTEGGIPPGEGLPPAGNGLPPACATATGLEMPVVVAAGAATGVSADALMLASAFAASAAATGPAATAPVGAAAPGVHGTFGGSSSSATASWSTPAAVPAAATTLVLAPEAPLSGISAAAQRVEPTLLTAGPQAANAAHTAAADGLEPGAPRLDVSTAAANAPRTETALQTASAAASPVIAGSVPAHELAARRASSASAAPAPTVEPGADSSLAETGVDAMTRERVAPAPRTDGVAALGRWLAESRAPPRTEGAGLTVTETLASATTAPNGPLTNATVSAPQHHAVAAGHTHTAAFGHGTLDLGDAAWNEQLSGRIRWLVDRDVGEARIKLHPADLGALDVKISLRDEQTFVQLGASSSAARDELEQALPRLRELLAQNGLTLAGATVSGGRDDRPSHALPRHDGYESAHTVNGVTPADGVSSARGAAVAAGRIDLFA